MQLGLPRLLSVNADLWTLRLFWLLTETVGESARNKADAVPIMNLRYMDFLPRLDIRRVWRAHVRNDTPRL